MSPKNYPTENANAVKTLKQIANLPFTYNKKPTTIGDYFKIKYPKYGQDYKSTVPIQSTQSKTNSQQTQQTNSTVNQTTTPTTNKINWRTNDTFPIKLYDKSVKYVTPIQQLLGLPQIEQKGYFGSITLNKLKEKGINVDPKLGIQNDQEYNNIIQKLRGNQQPMQKLASKQATLNKPTINTQQLA